MRGHNNIIPHQLFLRPVIENPERLLADLLIRETRQVARDYQKEIE
jgi:hypothetical protein